MKESELHAVGEYLSSWDDGMTFQDIIKALRSKGTTAQAFDKEEEDSVYVWEPFEYHPTAWVAEQIEGLERRSKGLNKVKPKKKNITKEIAIIRKALDDAGNLIDEDAMRNGDDGGWKNQAMNQIYKAYDALCKIEQENNK
jgi:hypothetical protein